MVDLFATNLNFQCQIYFAPFQATGCRNGCSPSELAGPSDLCFSSFQSDQESSKQGQTVSTIAAHSDRSSLVSVVVPGSAGGSNGTTSSATTERRFTPTASFPQVPSGSPIASTSCLETVRQFSRHEEFSREVARQLMSARKGSTCKVYQSKWLVYRSWCSVHGHSISNPSLPKIADFLLFLFQDKHLSVSAIKGHRSMSSFVFKSRLPEIASSYVIKDLIRSFLIQRSRISQSVLSWDVNKVLNALRASPFEPLEQTTLRDLTQKCLFLVSLATAKRVGEMQALSSTVVKKGRDLILSYIPHFIAKTESIDNPIPRSFPLKSLGGLMGELEEEELSICPVRCIKHYLKRTESIQARTKTLFISPRNGQRAISKCYLSSLGILFHGMGPCAALKASDQGPIA